MQQALHVCIIFQCLSTISNHKYCSPSHRHHVTTIIMLTPNLNKTHMKGGICLHSQFQDQCQNLVKFILKTQQVAHLLPGKHFCKLHEASICQFKCTPVPWLQQMMFKVITNIFNLKRKKEKVTKPFEITCM